MLARIGMVRRRAWLAVAAPFVLVGLGVAGFLISPLFIRPVLVEDRPDFSSAPAGGGPQAGSAPGVLARGTFDERDAVHKGSGDAILAHTADGKTVVRFENFSVTNGPDLYVYLSGHPRPLNSGELHQDEVNLGRLKAPQGAFSYEIDPGVDLSRIKSVVVYCRAFSVVFSSAALQ